MTNILLTIIIVIQIIAFLDSFCRQKIIENHLEELLNHNGKENKNKM